jgi:hypothetical protein
MLIGVTTVEVCDATKLIVAMQLVNPCTTVERINFTIPFPKKIGMFQKGGCKIHFL